MAGLSTTRLSTTRLSWAGDFVHLHVASAYSLRYGTASPAALAARAAELGMSALALTDRDGLYGAVKHAVACADAGIAPILGADLALAAPGAAPGGAASRNGLAGAAGVSTAGDVGDVGDVGGAARAAGPQRGPARLRTQDAARVTVLAEGRRGWSSLCRLVSAAHHVGERGAPAVSLDLIAAHAEGLIILLGPDSDVGRAIGARRPDRAARALARWRESAEVAVELVDHLTAGSTFRAARMLRLAREAHVPAVLTGAVRYLDPADAPVAHVLDAARRMVPLGRQPREDLAGRAHLAGGEEMARVAARVCGGSGPAGSVGPAGSAGSAGEVGMTRLLADTVSLARRCELDPERDLGIGGRFMPETVGNSFALVRARCEQGLNSRFPRVRAARRRTAARRRLDRELEIIAKTGLAGYFLTVADVADSIRAEGIRCSIRGSGTGSLVNYLLGISGIDPLEHDLIMERFLSEGRKGLPDIDLDVESARRLDAYRVIRRDYGDQRVACVSMMETYRARSAIRDVGAALGLPPHEIDAAAKAFPHIRAAHIRGALAQLPELRGSALAAPHLAAVFGLAERLDGLPRHVAMHPCGVVLSNASLLDRTPVESSIDGFSLSQFDKDDVETAGLIKLDVLGVRMQSAMAHALAEIERSTGERVDIDAVDHQDEAAFGLIRSARTLGCFQIESPGQRELVAKLQPRHMGDLIVDISLFRPGPVNSDMVTPYLDIRHGRRPACYPHEDLGPALAETGGVVIFHEQVLRVFDAMTGCGLSDAELARRALSEEETREEVREWFRDAARARGYDEEVVRRVWEVLAAFGAFGFCKAHAAAFAIPTYQSAWLKAHHPAAFYAGVLTHDPGMYPKRVIVGDARLAGIPILGVDVNASTGDWRVERTGPPPRDGLRAGLAEVKGISEAEVAAITAGQPYASLRDFWERSGASRPVTERLVLIGAFDSLYGAGRSGGAEPGGTAGCRVSRRDLLARVGVLDRSRTPPRAPARGRARRRRPALTPAGPVSARPIAEPQLAEPNQLQLDMGASEGDGFAGLVPAGELRELSPPERIEAELEILGIDLSQHVLTFYEELMAELGVARSRDLRLRPHGSQVLVAGVKVATQTPAIRSGQRIIFVTLDDATGPVDLAFFESAQDRCAARVFGSWLLAVRGRLRRTGEAVSVNGTLCWDLAALADIRAASGIRAVRAAMAAGDVPAAPASAAPVSAGTPAGVCPGPAAIVYPNGFTLSPFAESGSPGAAVSGAPRRLWHASPGSSGGWAKTGERHAGRDR